MTPDIWSGSDGEWKPLPGVTDFALSIGTFREAMTAAAIEAMNVAAENATRALENFGEALRRDIGPVAVPVVTMPCRQPHTVIWPKQYGKTAFTIEAPFSSALRACFEPLFAAARARQDRRLARLARQLGLYPEAVRLQLDAVLRILEAAGIADGYGNLTIRQPARPPIPPPVVPELVPVYADPFEQLARPPGTRPPLTLCSWKPRPRHAPPPWPGRQP